MYRHYIKKNRHSIAIFAVLFLLGFSYRIADYPPNFTPLAAISLFSGFYFRKSWALFLPVLILLFSDIFIGFYEWKILASVYGSFILIGLSGRLISKKAFAFKIALGSVAGSFLFFIATNFAVWHFSNWYNHNMQGLMHCFYMAIPFFRNTLMGDLFFSGVLFGCYELCYFYLTKDFSKSKTVIN